MRISNVIMFELFTFNIQNFQTTRDEEKTKIKTIVLDNINDFVVKNVFI